MNCNISTIIVIIIIVVLVFGLVWFVSVLGGFDIEQGKQICEEAAEKTESINPTVL